MRPTRVPGLLALLLVSGCTSDSPTLPLTPPLFSVVTAAPLVVSDEASCNALPPATTWTAGDCTLNEDLTLASSGSLRIEAIRLTVPAGVTLTNDGGTITVLMGGGFRIQGTLLNTGAGVIANSGFWNVRDGGVINNDAGSSITNGNQRHVTQGSLTNLGSLTNTSYLSVGNAGSVTTSGTIDNSGTIKLTGGTFANSGTINNTGTIDVGCSTGFTNTGTINGNPIIQPWCWVGGHGALWSTPANWNRNSTPEPAGPIILFATYSGPTLDVPFTLTGSLQMQLSTLTIAATAELTNQGTILLGQGGQFPGTAVIRNEGTFTNNAVLHNNDLFVNHGTATNNATMEPSAVVGVVENGGHFTNSAGAFFEGGLRGLAGGRFDNLGRVNLNRSENDNSGVVANQTGATMNVNNALANDSGGRIENDGTLNITHALNFPGRIDNAAGATIVNRAQLNITAADAALNNAGLVEHIGAMDNGGVIQNDGVICGGGTISGNPVSGNPPRAACNSAPTADPGGPYAGQEGVPIALAFGGSDPDGQPITFSWDLGDGTTGSGSTPPAQHTYGDNPTPPATAYTITLTVDDGAGGTDTQVTTVTVMNVAPALGSITRPAGPVPVGTPASISATFSDVGTLDTHTGLVRWNPGASLDPASPGVDQSAHTLTAEALLAPGVYQPELVVRDDDGGEDSRLAASLIVVFDPESGFLTGGGWFESPAGALVADPGAGGKGHFNFDARYQGSNVPDGDVSFELPSAGLDFVSTALSWMVVSPGLARLEGQGMVGGVPGYGIRVTASDRGTPGRRNDGVRVRIWHLGTGTPVYDNQAGEPFESEATTLLSGGNVSVHR